jgi:hypothetical protein
VKEFDRRLAAVGEANKRWRQLASQYHGNVVLEVARREAGRLDQLPSCPFQWNP